MSYASTLHPNRPVGELLREWRQRRRFSQLDLALDAEVSARHISFLETGRALPSRQMLLHLAEQLDIPLRERNTLLLAAGYAPDFRETPLDDAALRAARAAIELVLTGHEPYPALAVDRHWVLVMANRATGMLVASAAPELLEPPVNVLRLSLHPAGMAPRIVNLGQWRHHVLARLQHQVEATADPALAALHDELRGYPVSDGSSDDGRDGRTADQAYELVVPLRIRTDRGLLSFFSTTTVFGTANDITLAELVIESFFPADAATAEALRHVLPEETAGRVQPSSPGQIVSRK
jgi:transcriptional regulator with XRE-family HTH domain